MIAVSGVEVEEGNFNPGATAFNTREKKFSDLHQPK